MTDKEKLRNMLLSKEFMECEFGKRCLQFPYSLFANTLNYVQLPLYKVAEKSKEAPSIKMALP
jgi:hypothetical protein